MIDDPRGFRSDEEDEDDEDEDDEEDSAGKKRERPSMLEQDLLEARTVIVHGPVDDKMCAAFTARLLVLEDRDPKAPITVYVNSPGGSADSGFAMYDMLRYVKSPVRTIVNGLCASAAVLIFLGARKGSRFSLPSSRFLLHQPSTMGRGTASDLRITAEQIVRLRERYNRIVSEATGKPAEQIHEAVQRDFWLSAPEANEYGLVDRIIENHAQI